MKITIDIPDEMTADMVRKALHDESYRFEKRRIHFSEEYERIQNSDIIPQKRKAWYLDYNARRGAEQKLMCDTLWDIAESIHEQVQESLTQGLE